jgi:CDGSH-type Zn-finger protein
MPRVRILKNGPYIITGGVKLVRRHQVETPHGEPVEWEAGDDIATESDRYALCRCGHSNQKPFCDGSHAAAGFDGTLTADRSLSETRREIMDGNGVTLTDDNTLCADAGFCGTRLTSAWDMVNETGDPEVRGKLIRMASFCPSGRLQARINGQPIEPGFLPSAAIVPNGPIWVRGGVQMHSAEDSFEYEVRNRMTLCRCGASQNKPFCDGAHKSVGFTAE